MYIRPKEEEDKEKKRTQNAKGELSTIGKDK
jgi:hypothetical protein